MTADPEQLRFYVDESALGIGKTLTAARRDTSTLATRSSLSAHSEQLTSNGCQMWRRDGSW